MTMQNLFSVGIVPYVQFLKVLPHLLIYILDTNFFLYNLVFFFAYQF